MLGISLAGGVFAGSVLGTQGMVDGFERYSGLLRLLSAFLAMRGNVYGVLGARIAIGLHQGLIDPELSWDRRLTNAVPASFVNGIAISAFIGLLSWAILQLLGRASATLAELVGIMLVSGTLTATTLIVGLLAILVVL